MERSTLQWTVLAVCIMLMAPATGFAKAKGGLNLTARALIAVPRDNHTVFLTWRSLLQDGNNCAFDIYRSTSKSDGFEKAGSATATTTFNDNPGQGTYYYYVEPLSGTLKGRKSNVSQVITQQNGRDWAEILPAAKGKDLMVCDRHFVDTDGDGELEFLAYYPKVPDYRGGHASESYKIQIYELFDFEQPRWTYDTKMGLDGGTGNMRCDWDYEWTFKPVAHDIDGDNKAEIITLIKRDGKCIYVVLKDEGTNAKEIGTLEPPFRTCDCTRSARHFQFFGDIGGENYSFMLQTGLSYVWKEEGYTESFWEMYAYDWNGSAFDLRWKLKTSDPGFAGNKACSHTVLVYDVDGDGYHEFSNGVTMVDHDGTVMWAQNEFFGQKNHVDGQQICDIIPSRPGYEIMMHSEDTDKWAVMDVKTGEVIWSKHAAGKHLQLNVCANITDNPGLDIVGTWGGHAPREGFAANSDGTEFAWPYPELPLGGDRIWAMDWDGDEGYNLVLNFETIYGKGKNVLYKINYRDAPSGNTVAWQDDKEHNLHHLWFNVDIVGDYREDIPVQMKDGSIRVYVNTNTPPAKRPCKWQNSAYEMCQAPGDYRYFIQELNPGGPDAVKAGNACVGKTDVAGSKHCIVRDSRIVVPPLDGAARSIMITDLQGKVLFSARGAVAQAVAIETSRFPAGIYIINVNSCGFSSVGSFIVSRSSAL